MRQQPDRYRAAEHRYWQTEGPPAVSERWLDLPGSRARVRVQILGDGPNVLFVHGGSTAGTGWAPLATRLPGFTCILLDRPGCGVSEPLSHPKRTMDEFEPFADRLLADVLDAMDIEHAHVVATSFGSYFTLRAAAAHPNRIDHLALLGFPIGARVESTPLSMRMTALPGLGRLMSRIPVNERFARSMLRQLGLGPALEAGRLPQEGIDWFRSLLNDTNTMRNEIDGMPALMHWRTGLSPALALDDELLGRIRAPTLFLWGSNDPIGGTEAARMFVPRVPGARLEMLADAGHVPWLDDPDRVASTTHDHLAGVTIN